MKRILAKAFALLALLLLADLGVGALCRYLETHSKGGYTAEFNYIADQMAEPVVIFGSSKASHHYDPAILADSLGLGVYNAGRDGNGIIFAYGQYQLIRRRHPRVIIYDLIADFDIEQGDNTRYLNWLRRFHQRPGIDSIILSVDPTERWKMLSSMRQYNKQFIQIVYDYLRPQPVPAQGYRPLEGTASSPAPDPSGPWQTDTLKLRYMRRLIADCRADGVRLIFVVSPHYWPLDRRRFAPVEHMAAANDIPFLWHADRFLTDTTLFVDAAHLNARGAAAFTRLLVPALRPHLP